MESFGASPLSLTGTPTATSATSAGIQSARVNVGPFTSPAGSSASASPLSVNINENEVPAVQPTAASATSATSATSAAFTLLARTRVFNSYLQF